MTTTKATTRLTSLAPQLLVNDLARAIAYYERIGFRFAEPWDGFYAIGSRDGLERHLKEAPKSEAERRHRRKAEHLMRLREWMGSRRSMRSASRMAR